MINFCRLKRLDPFEVSLLLLASLDLPERSVAFASAARTPSLRSRSLHSAASRAKWPRHRVCPPTRAVGYGAELHTEVAHVRPPYSSRPPGFAGRTSWSGKRPVFPAHGADGN